MKYLEDLIKLAAQVDDFSVAPGRKLKFKGQEVVDVTRCFSADNQLIAEQLGIDGLDEDTSSTKVKLTFAYILSFEKGERIVISKNTKKAVPYDPKTHNYLEC